MLLEGPPGLSCNTAFQFSSPKDCKVGANSPKRRIIRFCLLYQVGLRYVTGPVTVVQILGRGGRDDAVAIKCCNTNLINL